MTITEADIQKIQIKYAKLIQLSDNESNEFPPLDDIDLKMIEAELE